ncbi:MAG: DNA polymerase IV [Fimbriimonas sp.]|nr:DNA polymerase IV [Fimbriimonas sp.]
MSVRQIVHIDMDAFYASVEQRDDPALREKPVVVAWLGNRSVVCAASYEARRFGIRSAMPAVTARRMCPSAIFVPPDFSRYRAVSQTIHEVFHRHTDLVEPLSLDEAYLDVTQPKSGLSTGLEVAIAIRAQIREAASLTASAGIAPNKFLAKIASDWRKPDGLFEVRPCDVQAFLEPMPVGKLPGVGKVTEQRLTQSGLETVGAIRRASPGILESKFGRFGKRLIELSCGVDESEVVSERPTQSISAEDTFESDLLLEETTATIERLANRVWRAASGEPRVGRTVVLKLKTSDFNIITRSHTPERPPMSESDLLRIALNLQLRVELAPETRYRLVGVGISNFSDVEVDTDQLTLFE